MIEVADHYERSDVGRQRTGNEDNFFVASPVFAVADGMGGAQAGEVASQIAVESFGSGLAPDMPPEQGLAQIARNANSRIYEMARASRERAGMGTTLTAAHIGPEEITLAHVGDSRAYLWRGQELVRLTRDHSLVDELVRRGKITEEEAAEHPQRSIITRALGPEPTVEVDTFTYRGQDGDLLLLCSDGLTSMISEAQVSEVLRQGGTLPEIGDALIAAANAAGGRDNITVVLFRLAETDRETADGDQPTGVQPMTAADVRAAIERAAAEEAATTPEPVAARSSADVTGFHSFPPAADATAATTAPQPAPTAAVAAPRKRRRRSRAVIATLAVLVTLFLVGIGAWLASRSVYFLGTDSTGVVTIYRGFPYELPFGLKLYEHFYASGVPATTLSAAQRKRLLDHSLRSRRDAEQLVQQLELGKLRR